MGDPRRKHKTYSRPRKPFDSVRIKEENSLLKKYGLKNKRELWKAEEAIAKIRKQAKLLTTESEEKQRGLIDKIGKIGIEVKNMGDVLALNKEDWLQRRLQSVLVKKGTATSPRGARQLITHRHIKIGDRIINVPSYVVEVGEEDKIKIVIKKPKKKVVPAVKEVSPIKENASAEEDSNA